MRLSVAGVLAVLSMAPLLIGCQQASLTGQSPLTPVQSTGTLSPVRATSGMGMLGESLRVSPPPTGGFSTSGVSVPNNYMGGSASNGQMGVTQPSLGPAIGSGFVNNQAMVPPSGVQPSGWVQSGTGQAGFTQAGQTQAGSFGGSFNPQGQLAGVGFAGSGFAGDDTLNQPLQANAQRPQSGGMKVIDLTGAPAPPGYTPSAYSAAGNGFQNQNMSGQFAGNQNQYYGQPNTGQPFYNQPSNRVAANPIAPAGYNNGSGAAGNFDSPVVNAFPQNESFRPSAQNNSAAPAMNKLMPSQLQTREFEMKASPLEPSWNGVSQFDDKTPSTEPVGSDFNQATDNLPWRRPDMQ